MSLYLELAAWTAMMAVFPPGIVGLLMLLRISYAGIARLVR